MIRSKKMGFGFMAFMLIMTFIVPSFLIPQKAKATGAPVFDAGTITALASLHVQEAPQTTEAVRSMTTEILRKVGQAAAVVLLKKFTQETVNWINQGNDGKPLYLTDSKSFFESVADEQIKLFTAQIGFDPQNHPYGKDFLTGYIQTYVAKKLNPLITNNYTLPATCASSFSWQCWEGQVSNPANNPFGDFIQKSKVLNNEIDRAISTIDRELSSSGGFLSVKICEAFQPEPTMSQEEYTDTTPGNIPGSTSGMGSIDNQQNQLDDLINGTNTGTNSNGSQNINQGLTTTGNTSNQSTTSGLNNSNISSANSPCAKWRTQTPGSIVGSQITSALSSGQEQKVLATALGNSVSAVFDALYNRFIADGLNNASSELFGLISDQDQADMWHYYGNELGGPITNESPTGEFSNWANGPDFIVDIYEELGLPYPDGTFSGTEGDLGGPDYSNVYKPVLISGLGSTGVGLQGTENTGNTGVGLEGVGNTGSTISTVENLFNTSDLINPTALVVKNLASVQVPEKISSIELARQESLLYKESSDIIKAFPEALYRLDRCLPGPDYGWENRFREALADETNRFQTKLSLRNEDNEKAQSASVELRGIGYRVDLAILAIRDRMLGTSIPSSVEIFDSINSKIKYSTKYKEIYGEYLERKITQKRLEVIRDLLKNGEISVNEAIYRYTQLYISIPTQDSLFKAAEYRETLGTELNEISKLKDKCVSEINDIKIAHPILPDGGTRSDGSEIPPGETGFSYWDGFHNIRYDLEEDNPYHWAGYRTYPAHMWFYCKSIINSCPEASGSNTGITEVPAGSTCITLDNVFKQKNFELACHDFYQSNSAEYFFGSESR